MMTTNAGKRGIPAAITLAVALFGATAARAEHMGPRPFPMPFPGPGPGAGAVMIGEGPDLMLPLIFRRADLTQDQHAQIKKILKSDRAALHDLFKQLEAANSQLADRLFAAGTTQAADLAPLVQKITDLRHQLMEHGVKTALAIRAVLTPEQLAKVTELKARMDKVRAEMQDIFVDDGD